MKIHTAIAIIGLSTTHTAPAATPFLSGPRDEINLAGKDWQEAISDTLNMNRIPNGLTWTTASIPGAIPKLKSTDNQWSYCELPPEKYFAPDGSLLTKEKLSDWYKRKVDIPDG